MYWKHLVSDGKIEISNPQSSSVACTLTEAQAESLIAAGRIKPMGSRRKAWALTWIGPALKPEAERETPGHDLRHHTRYSYKFETDQNPQNVWALVKLPVWQQLIFLAVVASCGGLTKIRRKARA